MIATTDYVLTNDSKHHVINKYRHLIVDPLPLGPLSSVKKYELQLNVVGFGPVHLHVTYGLFLVDTHSLRIDDEDESYL